MRVRIEICTEMRIDIQMRAKVRTIQEVVPSIYLVEIHK
jgi:hypothetical protein